MNPAQSDKKLGDGAISLYYAPYYPTDTPTLKEVPTAGPQGVKRITLAFAGPDTGSTATIAYMFSSGRTKAALKADITAVKTPGDVLVGLAIIDNPDNQWPQVDKLKFSRALKSILDEMGLDYYVTIDAESDTATSQDYIDLIDALVEVMPSVRLAWVGLESQSIDTPVLTARGSRIEEAQSMFYNSDLSGLKESYDFYANPAFNIKRVAPGIKQGVTSNEAALDMCAWPRPDSKARYMMVWNANRHAQDQPYFWLTKQMISALQAPPKENTQGLYESLRQTLSSLVSMISEEKRSLDCPVTAGNKNEISGYASMKKGQTSKPSMVPLDESIHASRKAKIAPQ